MNTEASTQDHERTVSAARSNMAWHDGSDSLRRWFYNYKDDKDAFWFGWQWCVVTRDGRRWKIETGNANDDKPSRTLWADPHAPAPPVLEFRPPPPEPVKPRAASPPPFRVPSAMQYIQHMLSPREFEEFMRRLRRRQRVRPRVPTYNFSSYGAFDTVALEQVFEIERPEPPSDRDLMALAHDILHESWRFHHRASERMPTPPPPPLTRRNQ